MEFLSQLLELGFELPVLCSLALELGHRAPQLVNFVGPAILMLYLSLLSARGSLQREIPLPLHDR